MLLTLPLLVTRILLANDAYYASTLDHSAMLANGLNAAANLHVGPFPGFVDSF
jgi:hypothetical protein